MAFIALIGGGITAGLGALGVGAATAGTIGAVAAPIISGAAIGSGLGAVTSAISGGDPGEGAAMGAIGGAATGGLGSLMGGAGGAAAAPSTGALGNTAQVGASLQTPVSSIGENAWSGAMNSTFGSGAPVQTAAQNVANTALASQPATTALSGGLTGFGGVADRLAMGTVLEGGKGVFDSIQQNARDEDNRRLGEQYAANKGFGSFADGGYATLRAARGGSIQVRDGAFVIPADVVSALGNGSSKAGAKYLTQLFKSLEQGPPKKAGDLAAGRAMKRHSKRSAA